MQEGKQLILSVRNNVLRDSFSQGTNMALTLWSGLLGHKQKSWGTKVAKKKLKREKLKKGHFERLHFPPE